MGDNKNFCPGIGKISHRTLYSDKAEIIKCPLSITLSHRMRGKESLSDFGAQDDYIAYHPWFQIDTWLLNGKSQHPIITTSDFTFDKLMVYEPLETDRIMAVNLMTYGPRKRRGLSISLEFLLVEQTAPGEFRRVGRYKLELEKDKNLRLREIDLHSSMVLVKAAALERVQESVPDMAWELQERTVRLV